MKRWRIQFLAVAVLLLGSFLITLLEDGLASEGRYVGAIEFPPIQADGGDGLVRGSEATASNAVEIFEGDMPLLFAVGHGGWKPLGDLKNASQDFDYDPLLREYFLSVLAVRIYEKTGHLPYVVYQQGQRNYVNTNRSVDHPEAYHSLNDEARAAYFEFHNQVDAMIARIESRFGADLAVMINPHTAPLEANYGNRPWDRIAEIGFRVAADNLGSDSNTMKALYDRRGAVALRGEDSIPFQFFHGQDFPSPDAVWPAAATTNSKTLAQSGDDVWHVLPAWVTGWGTDYWSSAYLNGAYTIIYHGTNAWSHHPNWSNGLDAFQIEVNYLKGSGLALDEPGYHILDMPFTTAVMDDFSDAILHSLRVNYSWTPGRAYNVIVDNGEAGFSTTASWHESSGQGYWGTRSVYSDETGETATWTPNLSRSGTYEVFVRWTDEGSRTDRADYTLFSSEGEHSFFFDQSAGQDAKWISLGEFEFGAGTAGRLVLVASGVGTVSADAVLFRLVQDLDGTVVDNSDPGFSTTGDWAESEAEGEYASSSLYSDSEGSKAIWTPNLAGDGIYHAYAWWTYWPTRAQHAPYTINHAFGSQTHRVDQRENAGRWQLLGTFGFRAGTASLQSVVLTREEGDGTSTSADAVRFVKVGGPLVDVIHLPLFSCNY